MNRWLQNYWVLRLLALIIAIALWVSASNISLPFLSDKSYITTKRDVPIYFRYDEAHYELVEPKIKTANLKLAGDTLFYQYLVNYRLYVDLMNKGPGVHYNVPIQVKGIPANVSFEVKPRTVTVTIKER